MGARRCLKAGVAHVHETHESEADGTEKYKIGQLRKLLGGFGAARPADRATAAAVGLPGGKEKKTHI